MGTFGSHPTPSHRGAGMPKIIISEKLIELDLEADSKEQAIRVLADKLSALGYVKEGYYENVIQREKDYPTGLPSVIPVAVCHTEAQYVNRSSMAVGTLRRPVAFSEMGTPERSVMAEIIFLIALNDPKDQVPWLKKMAGIFKNKEALTHIKTATNKRKLASYLKSLLIG